jgi:electron transfer flavoprotein alpha subunit
MQLLFLTPVALVQGDDTFVRPIYAGNALSTVRSSDVIKLITVRPTNFEKVLQLLIV